MAPTRWQQLQDLVSATLELPFGERAAFLRKACNGDSELQRQAEELLKSVEQSGSALEEAVGDCAEEILADNISRFNGEPPPLSKMDEGRFLPGALLAERYRLVSLLGRGGMGEVYRANDLILGQVVALKFLPPEWTSDQAMIARFRNEVRIARQISHPNVCRVYDIGEAEGSMYLSMEYVDGEDLASLLRRIGRLPQEKAFAIAHQLCAGLAAAHDKGIVHRDLKPGNIMLDGRGHLRITDLGLAAMAGEAKDIRSGTPAYMAPEQRSGRAVTTRSDIYSLGVVLQEILTGSCSPSSSSLAALSSEVDRVIRRCLSEDPIKRPKSALAVSSALPGGGPLVRAMAAGETPSPEMVAAAGEAESISVRTIGLCLAWIVAGLAGTAALGGKTNLLTKTPFARSPAVLEQKARDVIRNLGYTTPPIDRAYGFLYAQDYQRYAEQEKKTGYQAQLLTGQPQLIYFWYRQSPRYLEATPADDVFGPVSVVSLRNPPPTEVGMIDLDLDPEGRLIRFGAVPPRLEQTSLLAEPANWTALLAASGLDMNRFSPAEPLWVPPVGFDKRAAWTGSYALTPRVPIRIEAASWRGRPVFFKVVGPWSQPESTQSLVWTAGNVFQVGFLICMLLLAMLITWKNIRRDRGDLRGATRLAAFVFSIRMLSWICGASHVPTPHEFGSFLQGLAAAFWGASTIWVVYVALEPYVRRRWPEVLIAWSRLLSAGLRDGMVAGHLLIGIAFGIALAIQGYFFRFLSERSGGLPITAQPLEALLGANHMVVLLADQVMYSILLTLVLLLFLSLLRSVCRSPSLAAVVFVVACTLLGVGSFNQGPLLVWVNFGLASMLLAWILIRFGVLTLLGSLSVFQILRSFPLTPDLSTWYAACSIFPIATLLTLTGFFSYTALAGRPLFKTEFLSNE